MENGNCLLRLDQMNLPRIIIIIFCCFSISICKAQGSKIDSVLHKLSLAKEDSNKVNLLNNYSKLLWQKSEYDSAMIQASLAIQLSKKLKFNRGVAFGSDNLGTIQWYKGNYPEALKSYFVALQIRETNNDKGGIAVSYGNIANVYLYQGNFPEAVKNYSEAIKTYENLCAQANDNLKVKYNETLASLYNNLGNTLYSQGNVDGALEYFLKALKIREALGNKQDIAGSLSNIGIIYEEQGNYSEAIINYSAAMKIVEEIDDKEAMAGFYINIGTLNIRLKNIIEAESHLKKALLLSFEIKNKEDIKECYQGLTMVDSIRGNYKSALENYKMYILYSDSLVNDENTKLTVETQMNHEFNKKQTADSITNFEHLKQEQLKHDQEIQQQRLYTLGGGIGFAMMLIVAGVSLRAYRNKQKANDIISLQKVLVEEKQKEILDSIHYAKRIQRSLLPTEKYIHKTINRLND